jgi:nucleosome assembly protein 1-like 1
VDGVEDKEKYGEEKPKEAAAEKDVKGIPHFWLTAMKNVELFDPLIKEWDNPALEKLTDIRVVYPEDSGLDFILEFHFDENDYFTQRVLTKKYKIKCDVDPDSPFSFEGPEIILSEGCKISWKDNKNLTLKTVKKTQKHKSKGQTRTVTKTVHQESFFDFFNGVPERTDDDDDEEEEQGDVRELDFARGEFFRDSFIQKAVLFFTGEIENDDDDYDDEDEDYLNDEDYNEEGDPDFVPAIGPGGEGKPAECKQQ